MFSAFAGERTRYVYQWWDRDPSGKHLSKQNTPRGKRAPNGAVWGHSIDDFFMIQRIPGVNVVTCWSRSMIKELGELPIDDGDEPHPPRIRRPYPLLKIDEGVGCLESSMYSCFDEGSEHGDPIPVEDSEGGGTGQGSNAKAEVKDPKGKMRANPSPPNPKREYVYQGKNGYIHRSLEEDIPQQFFPDQLIVTDPYSLALGKGGSSEINAESPWIYERLYPSFNRDLSADRFAEDPITAKLSLDPAQSIGMGNHSMVYRATLTLPKGLSARTPDGKVTAVAKVSFPHSRDRLLLHNEGKIFSSFPKDLSQEWCGLNMISPLAWPVPVGPVVPKFYGYYMPTGEKKDTLSPILLMEECGTPIEPRKLKREQKYVSSVSSSSLSSGSDVRTWVGPSVTLCTCACTLKGTFTARRTSAT